METEEGQSFITDELPEVQWILSGREFSDPASSDRTCLMYKPTWGRGRWLCGSWRHLRCHSGPCRVWWHRWGLGEASQPRQRWTGSEGSATPCPGLPLSAGPGYREGDQNQNQVWNPLTEASLILAVESAFVIFFFSILLITEHSTSLASVFWFHGMPLDSKSRCILIATFGKQPFFPICSFLIGITLLPTRFSHTNNLSWCFGA